MVVLEGGGVVTIGNNQYLQPDYLSPLPTTLDAKKSPLALLAQTCSQIGADSSTVKPLLSAEKRKSENSKSPSATPKTPKLQVSATTTTMSPEIKHLAFKPYEANVLTTRPDDRPPSKANSVHNNNNSEESVSDEKSKQSARAKSNSPQISVSNGLADHQQHSSNKLDNGKNTPNTSTNGGDRKSASPSTHRGASPIIRSGMEVLQGHPKDSPLGAYKPGMFGMSPMSALCCPPGMEQHTNPAFRPPFAGGFSPHHAALLAAAAAGYPTAASQNPYLSYARVKTPSGGETLVPVCKDPYCTGCQFSAHNQQMMMGAPCPSGCTQCEHQKYGLAMAAMSQIPPGHPYAQLGRPYICNWMAGGEGYCGKRFATSDELLQHVRSHTPNINDPNLLQSVQQSMLPLGSLFSQGVVHRTYPTPPLSPMSAARYHPYGKPGQMPATMPGSPYAAFNPAAAAALGSYYSPYAMYGQRLGAAAVHP